MQLSLEGMQFWIIKKKKKIEGTVVDFAFQCRGCGFDPWSGS